MTQHLQDLIIYNSTYENEKHAMKVYKRICPKNARLARVHGLTYIHKDFVHLPKFQPIIVTTNSTHYRVRQYLSTIFQPFTINDYNIKDSFDIVN